MTKEEKFHKIKLVMLILICKAEITRRNPHKTIKEAICNAIEVSYWMAQLRLLMQPLPKYKKGSIVEVNSQKREEVLIDKNGNKQKIQ